MKRYIKASFSESTPEWLKRRLQRKGFDSFKDKFLQKHRIALDKANYTSEPSSSKDIPIYLLKTDYSSTIYAPGVNDDETTYINDRYRKLGSIAKSKLPYMAEAVVYIDINDPANIAPQKERYQDPRYTYRYSNQGSYAGQYKKRNYNYDTKEYEEGGWSDKGMTPSNESRARDKSGYKIPSPEQRLTEYYEKYPDRIRNKIDNVYDLLIETKQMLMDADFNTGLANRYYQDNIGTAYRRFSDAIYDYRKLLTELDSSGKLDEYNIRHFGQSISSLKRQITEVQELLSES